MDPGSLLRDISSMRPVPKAGITFFGSELQILLIRFETINGHSWYKDLDRENGISLTITRMNENTEILREIRDLLRLMAEPALAKRDERFRASLHQIVGKSKQKAEAVLLMNGSRTQTEIRKLCGIDDGNLSRLVKALREAELIGPDDKSPKLVFPAPSDLSHNAGRD